MGPELLPGGGCLDGKWEGNERQPLHRSHLRPVFGEHRLGGGGGGALEAWGQEYRQIPELSSRVLTLTDGSNSKQNRIMSSQKANTFPVDTSEK